MNGSSSTYRRARTIRPAVWVSSPVSTSVTFQVRLTAWRARTSPEAKSMVMSELSATSSAK